MTGLLEAARKFVGLFSETPEKLELRFNPPGTAGFPPTTVTRHDEERILLELVCEHGYGEWRKIRSDFRSRPEFQFDWFLKTLDPEQIGRRCEVLIRSAEREMAELQRRHDAYIDAAKALAAARKGAPRDPSTGKPLTQPQRVVQMFEQMVEDKNKQDTIREKAKQRRSRRSAPRPCSRRRRRRPRSCTCRRLHRRRRRRRRHQYQWARRRSRRGRPCGATCGTTCGNCGGRSRAPPRRN